MKRRRSAPRIQRQARTKEPPEKEETETKEDEEDEEEICEEEDEEDPPTREGTVEDTGASNYWFKFTLRKHCDFDSQQWVRGQVMHRPAAGQMEQCVGDLKGNLIDRNHRPRWNFHELCDAESEELQGMSTGLCNPDGTMRFDRIENLNRDEHSACSHGGFLQVELVRLEQAHRGRDIGLRFFCALLEWLTDSWSLALIQPAPLNDHRPTAEEMIAQLSGPPAPAQQQSRQDATSKICRHFARLGFRQAAFGSEYWYLPSTEVVSLKKTDVVDLQITQVGVAPLIEDIDRPLADLIVRLAAADRDMLDPGSLHTAIRQAVERGASASRINALHRGAANGMSRLSSMALLVELGQSVNQRDFAQNTPLHCTASRLDTRSISALIKLGADRTLKNSFGRTPSQDGVRALQDSADFRGCFGLPDYKVDSPEFVGHKYDALLLLVREADMSALVDGCLTPRMHERLVIHSEIAQDMARENFQDLTFTNRVPMPEDELCWLHWWDHIPLSVRQAESYKSFVEGWIFCIEAIWRVLKQRKLPTVLIVKQMLSQSQYDQRKVAFFLNNGGCVEFALDAMLSEVVGQSERFGDGNTDEAFGDQIEAHQAIPELDDDYEYMRCRLGLLGLARGPF